MLRNCLVVFVGVMVVSMEVYILIVRLEYTTYSSRESCEQHMKVRPRLESTKKSTHSQGTRKGAEHTSKSGDEMTKEELEIVAGRTRQKSGTRSGAFDARR
jgi:hypothetical protein